MTLETNKKDNDAQHYKEQLPDVNTPLIDSASTSSSSPNSNNGYESKSSSDNEESDQQITITSVDTTLTAISINDLPNASSDPRDNEEDIPSFANHGSQTRRRSSVTFVTPEILQHLILQPHGKKSSLSDGILIPVVEEECTVPTKLWPQVAAAIAVSLGSMIIGLSSAYTSPAIASMNEPNSTLWIELEGEEASWIGSLMPLGALLGGIIGGTLVETLGRKRTILATGIPFILTWLLIALASNIFMIYIARAITGICVGIICLSLPVYLAETVQPEVRGTLGLLPTTIGNGGILIAYIGGTYLNWSNLAYLGAGLSVPFLVCMTFIPETPRWYIANGKEEKGEESLQWFRGAGADIKKELHQIKNTHLMSKKYAAKLKDLLGKAYMKPLIVSLGLMFFQQFSGINAVIFYSNAIFKMTGSTLDENLCSIIIGCVNICATIFATVLIDRVGRKVLLLISDSIMILTLVSLGTFFYMKEHHEETILDLGWIPLVSFMLFVVAFSLGFGPIPWLMMGEIFPARIRGSAAATATAFNWACTFLVTKCFPEVVGAFGAHTAFFGFGVICVVGILFIVFYVPETQGQSLEDIERNLTRPFRRISSTANLKPFPMSM